MKYYNLLLIPLLAGLLGCEPNNPADNLPDNNINTINVTGKAAPLTQEEFNALTPEQQYRVANKLLGTMFRGISVSDFFDLSKGITNLTPKDPNFLHTIANSLTTSLPTPDEVVPGVLSIDEIKRLIGGYGNPAEIFNFSMLEDGSPKEIALAQTTQLPLSRDAYNHWIAYILTNTILFSPAEEIDSTSIYDVQAVYSRLVEQLDDNNTIAQMILRHENSQENWRRFRSPEDNTREMIEIYLGIFVPEPDGNEQNDVVNASKACQNYYLTDDASEDPYRWVDNGNYNTSQVLVLDTFVVSCSDFYQLVAQHPSATPRMVSTIVETFMLDRSGADRAAMIESISNAGPTTFQEIFTAVLFSKEYLLYTERTKSFEENFYNMAARLKYNLETSNFRDTATCGGANNCSNVMTYLGNMNWPTMTNKLGRLAGVPVDTLSFAHYHRGLREQMIIDSNRYNEGLITTPDIVRPDIEGNNGNVATSTFITSMSNDDFLDYLFLSMLERTPDATERSSLNPFITGANRTSAQLVFDYISRLPEQYYFNCTKGMATDGSGNFILGECVR